MLSLKKTESESRPRLREKGSLRFDAVNDAATLAAALACDLSKRKRRAPGPLHVGRPFPVARPKAVDPGSKGR
jgi:hypothetical protein